MTPYFEAGGITIYKGDCREIVPALPAPDLLVTDPPYGMNFQSNYRKVKHARIAGDDVFSVALLENLVARATRAAYVFCRWDNLAQMPRPKSVLAWVKNNWSMGDLKHEHGRQWEAILFYAKENHKFIKRIPDVIYAARTGNVLHPTQKPTEVCEKLIANNEGDLVLDPFMGSGSTLLAARNCGRRAIGIEIDERYCEIAARRLEQKKDGPSFPSPEIPREIRA